MDRNEKIRDILLNTIGNEPTPWQIIVGAVQAQITIKNWLEVRGIILQFLLNKKVIARTNSIHKEEYYKL